MKFLTYSSVWGDDGWSPTKSRGNEERGTFLCCRRLWSLPCLLHSGVPVPNSYSSDCRCRFPGRFAVFCDRVIIYFYFSIFFSHFPSLVTPFVAVTGIPTRGPIHPDSTVQYNLARHHLPCHTSDNCLGKTADGTAIDLFLFCQTSVKLSLSHSFFFSN